MPGNLDTVKRLNELCEAKNFEEAAKLLHPQYKLKDPLMSFDGPEEFIEGMKNCPVTGKFENIEMAELGPDKVIQVIDCKMTAPVTFKMRMCDLLTFKDGKVLSEETFYDPSSIPEEARTDMKGMPIGQSGKEQPASRA